MKIKNKFIYIIIRYYKILYDYVYKIEVYSLTLIKKLYAMINYQD